MAIITVADTHSLSLPRTFPAKRKTNRKEGGLERRREEGSRGRSDERNRWRQRSGGVGVAVIDPLLAQFAFCAAAAATPPSHSFALSTAISPSCMFLFLRY